MPNANFVCTVCSQTFTRRWRGKKHNIQLHYGNATIVRQLDYIIGRLNGRYQPGDPSLYRSKKSNPISRESTHTNSIPGATRQARSLIPKAMDISNRGVGDFAQSQSPYNASTKTNDTILDPQEIANKMAKLTKLLEKNMSSEDARNTVKRIFKWCRVTDSYEPLDMALDAATRGADITEYTDYHSRS